MTNLDDMQNKFLVVCEDLSTEKFIDKMMNAESDILIEFLGKDYLTYDKEGNIEGTIDIELAIKEALSKKTKEEIYKYWNVIVNSRPHNR
jgi:hypothetical protein